MYLAIGLSNSSLNRPDMTSIPLNCSSWKLNFRIDLSDATHKHIFFLLSIILPFFYSSFLLSFLSIIPLLDTFPSRIQFCEPSALISALHLYTINDRQKNLCSILVYLSKQVEIH